MKCFNLQTVVWGQAYTKTFADAVFPSLFAPGNIPAMAAGSTPVKYRIYTTARDAEVIRQSPAFELGRNTVPIEFDVNMVTDLLRDDTEKRKIFNLCYAHAIEHANTQDAAWVGIMPDLICSDGSFSTVAALAKAGKRLIFAPCAYRTYKDLYLPTILSNYKLADGSISISAHDLVDMSIDCICEGTQGIFWGNYAPEAFHWGVYWHVKNQGLLLRSYCCLPILIYPENKDELPVYKDLSIEATDYLERAVPNVQDIYSIEDADDFFALDLEHYPPSPHRDASIPRRFVPLPLQTPSIIEFALIGKNYMKSVHARNYLKAKIRMRYRACDAEGRKEWQKVEAQSDKFIRRVFVLMNLICKYPLLERIAKKCRPLEIRVRKSRMMIKIAGLLWGGRIAK